MTKQNFFSKIKTKFLLVLAIICLISFSTFVFTACKDKESTDTNTSTATYSKTETDESVLKNGTFELGMYKVKSEDLPLSSSISNWNSVSTEKSSTSSLLKSGIVNTSDESWSQLIKNICKDTDFMNYAKGIHDDVNEENLKTYFPQFENPGSADDGKNILMLNNYTSDDWYTAQTIASSTKIDLEKGSYGKITFSVNAKNLIGGEYLANVRINSTYNSETQAQYKLYGINNTEGWKTYSIYVKADSAIDTSISVVLSLGYCEYKNNILGNTLGTVYFDNLKYETVSKEDFDTAFPGSITDTITFAYGNKDATEVAQKITANTDYLYDLELKDTEAFNNKAISDPDLTSYFNTSADNFGFTKSNVGNITSKSKFAENCEGTVAMTSNEITFTGLKNASCFAKLEQTGSVFNVEASRYVYLSFAIENKLNRLGNTNINVYLEKEDGTKEFVQTFNEVGEISYCHILIKNNFPAYKEENAGDETKSFALYIYVGPVDVAKTSVMNDFATGSVTIKDVTYCKDTMEEFERDSDGNFTISGNEKVKTDYFDLYSAFSSVSNAISIDSYYEEDTDTYYLSASKSAYSNTAAQISSINGYTGVSYDNSYVKKDSTNYNINTRIGNGENGSYAGLINSKYLASYPISITDLNYTGEKAIQPIMIYNSNSDSYGFIGTPITLSSASYAKLSVKVRVTGDAKAYVYLVNTSDESKAVATFGFEKGNVSGEKNYYDNQFSKKLSFENIDKDMMGENGWLTLTFYIATGADSMNLRLELWNGSRDGENKSQGFVFYAFDAFNENETFTPFTSTSAFTEPEKAENAYNTAGNPLYDEAFTNGLGKSLIDNAVKYVRELDAVEIKYNNDKKNETKVSYKANYVWADSLSSNGGVIYAVYNTVNPVAVDPNAENEATEEETGCSAKTDPSTFWLSFSSILLAVVLVLAIIMLVLKKVYRRRKANKKDGTSHYKVSSRYQASKNKDAKKEKSEKEETEKAEEPEEEPTENETENKPEETEEKTEEVKDEYVYGEVQDFGTETTENKETSEEVKEENKNNE